MSLLGLFDDPPDLIRDDLDLAPNPWASDEPDRAVRGDVFGDRWARLGAVEDVSL
jgi:hypothetical protein